MQVCRYPRDVQCQYMSILAILGWAIVALLFLVATTAVQSGALTMFSPDTFKNHFRSSVILTIAAFLVAIVVVAVYRWVT